MANELAETTIDETLPSVLDEYDRGLPPSLRLLLDPVAHERIMKLAVMMAQADGLTPAHLLGKPAACHVIINMAFNWKLDPHFVARETFQATAGGPVGFQGKLVQAILSKSNRFIGAPTYEFTGDWSKIFGKFSEQTGRNGRGKFYVPTWTDKDAAGLGIRVTWKLRGEAEPRVWPGANDWFYVTQAHPRNSPLWATDPKQQLQYLAIRRFANSAAPEMLGGMPFDVDELIAASDAAVDITGSAASPPAQGVTVIENGDFARGMPSADAPIVVTDVRADGTTIEHSYADPMRVVQALAFIVDAAIEAANVDRLRATLAANVAAFKALREAGHGEDAAMIRLRGEAAGKRMVAEAEAAAAQEQPNAADQPKPPPQADNSPPFPGDAPVAAENDADAPRNEGGDELSDAPVDPFWSGSSLDMPPPTRNGKADWNAWRAQAGPRLAACPALDLLDVWIAYNDKWLRQFQLVAGAAAYKEWHDENIAAARRRFGV